MKNNLPPPLLFGLLTFASSPLPAAESPPPARQTDPVVLSIFQVRDDKDEGYRSTQTVSGSRTLADLRDTPNSISVVNRELLDDLIATTVADAMYFVRARQWRLGRRPQLPVLEPDYLVTRARDTRGNESELQAYRAAA